MHDSYTFIPLVRRTLAYFPQLQDVRPEFFVNLPIKGSAHTVGGIAYRTAVKADIVINGQLIMSFGEYLSVIVAVSNGPGLNVVAVHLDMLFIPVAFIDYTHCNEQQILSAVEIEYGLRLILDNSAQCGNDAAEIILIYGNIFKFYISALIRKEFSQQLPALAHGF